MRSGISFKCRFPIKQFFPSVGTFSFSKIFRETVMVLIVLFSACRSKTCALLEYPVSERPFSPAAWRSTYLENDSLARIAWRNDPTPYQNALLDRERMLCDLAGRILKPNFSPHEVRALLGPETAGVSFPAYKPLGLPEGQHLDDTELKVRSLAYPAGFNASGFCYIIVVFREGQYDFCFRLVSR